MWKVCVVLGALLLGYSNAGIASWSEDISVHNNAAVTGIHYSQHESSVNAAQLQQSVCNNIRPRH